MLVNWLFREFCGISFMTIFSFMQRIASAPNVISHPHCSQVDNVAHRGLAENQTGGVDYGQDVEEGNEGVQGWLEPGGQHAVVAPANEEKHPGKEQERVEGDQKASPYYLGQWRSGGEIILCAHVVIVPLDDGGNYTPK